MGRGSRATMVFNNNKVETIAWVLYKSIKTEESLRATGPIPKPI
jgi:hypothetical protein